MLLTIVFGMLELEIHLVRDQQLTKSGLQLQI